MGGANRLFCLFPMTSWEVTGSTSSVVGDIISDVIIRRQPLRLQSGTFQTRRRWAEPQPAHFLLVGDSPSGMCSRGERAKVRHPPLRQLTHRQLAPPTHPPSSSHSACRQLTQLTRSRRAKHQLTSVAPPRASPLTDTHTHIAGECSISVLMLTLQHVGVSPTC